MSNSNRFTITQENWALFADSTQIGSDPILPLIDGGVDRTSWAPFAEGANGDGRGTFLGGDETDPAIASDIVPARLITAWQNDLDDVTHIDMVVHPYGGITSAGEVNNFTVFMYLNGGDPVKASFRIREGKHGNDSYVVYSCAVPSTLTGSNEVRAVVVPAYGKATILQSQMVDGSVNFETRGCLLHKYTHDVTVGPSGTYSTVTEAVTAVGTTAVRCTLSGATYEEGSIFTYNDAAYVAPTNDPTDLLPMPILKSDGSAVVIASDVSSSLSQGFIIDNCQVYVKPDPNNAGAGIRNPRNDSVGFIYNTGSASSTRAPYFSLRNVTGGIKKDTTQYPGVPSTAHGDALIAKGLGVPMLQFYRGNTPKTCALNLVRVNGSRSSFTHMDGCDLLLTCMLAGEVIDTRTVNPPSGYDVYNSNLAVGTSDQGTAKYMYPWASVGGDVISDPFTFDYTAASFGSSQNYVAVNSVGKAASAFNNGVWPDWYSNSDTVTDMTAQPWINNGDGTYTDHHGNTTTGWPFSYTTGADPHFDTFQMTNRTANGPAIITGHRAFGDLRDTQGIFATVFDLDGWSLGVWDVQYQPCDSAQKGISVGINNGNVSQRAQHWGPDVYYGDVNGPLGDTVRDYTTTGTGDLYARPSNPNVAAWQNMADGVNWRLKSID